MLPAHLVQVIVDKADGNPFFLEELTRTVIELKRREFLYERTGVDEPV